MSTKYIFNQPDYVEGVGNIYPITTKDYHIFVENQNFLGISPSHLEVAEINTDIVKSKEELKLLDFIMLITFQEGDKRIIKSMEKILSLVLKKDIKFTSNNVWYGFIIDENHLINNSNYDEVRKVVMKQNLMFETKVYKNKLVQEWANKIIASKQKNGLKYTFEDMLTTVSCFKGLSYKDIAEESIYAIHADFSRIIKMKDYDTSVDFKCAGAEGSTISHFAEEINMYKNPYDDLFVEKDKLKNINKAFN